MGVANHLVAELVLRFDGKLRATIRRHAIRVNVRFGIYCTLQIVSTDLGVKKWLCNLDLQESDSPAVLYMSAYMIASISFLVLQSGAVTH